MEEKSKSTIKLLAGRDPHRALHEMNGYAGYEQAFKTARSYAQLAGLHEVAAWDEAGRVVTKAQSSARNYKG